MVAQDPWCLPPGYIRRMNEALSICATSSGARAITGAYIMPSSSVIPWRVHNVQQQCYPMAGTCRQHRLRQQPAASAVPVEQPATAERRGAALSITPSLPPRPGTSPRRSSRARPPQKLPPLRTATSPSHQTPPPTGPSGTRWRRAERKRREAMGSSWASRRRQRLVSGGFS